MYWVDMLAACSASSQAVTTFPRGAVAEPEKKSPLAEKPVDTISSAPTSSLSPHMEDWMSHPIIQEFIKNYPLFEKLEAALNTSSSSSNSSLDVSTAHNLSFNMTPQPNPLQFEKTIKPEISAERSPIPHGFKVNPTSSTTPGTEYQDSGSLSTMELFKAINAQRQMAFNLPIFVPNFAMYSYPSAPLSTSSISVMKKEKKKKWDKNSEEYKEHRSELLRRNRQKRAEKEKKLTVQEIVEKTKGTAKSDEEIFMEFCSRFFPLKPEESAPCSDTKSSGI
ncbi:hypothetical protein GCK72_025904 [Caenorhabditis remanei]|uniref:Uncharacterized protein n=1 Tax=Caenorhabditis remanei TaxID=31234 RepID=A0A6A5G3G1_CAERE|nr:hypothetical protein GCK72_025904 [Caenorhabditis remanei]KAF1749436.1 hypothetical protein GCK72_025904 [Caenorhabditis remanei]